MNPHTTPSRQTASPVTMDEKDPPAPLKLVPPFSRQVSIQLRTLGAVTPTISQPEARHGYDTQGAQLDDEEDQGDASLEMELPEDVMETLPTIFRDNTHTVSQVKDAIPEFVAQDLSVERLNRIHGWLWMAGRPLNARPLHRYKMLDLRILHTEQADLHLLRVSDRMFIKPLPPYLLDYSFWERYLCTNKSIHESACGLLVSYIWLICSTLDLKMAHERGLVPKPVTWLWWKSFVQEISLNIDLNALDTVNKRYEFGELRLGRINSIYRLRFFFTHFIRGYLYGYNRYVVFFQRNFGWMLVVFVYFSLVLSAMQVAVGASPLNENKAFLEATFGFVVFSIVLVAAVVALVAVLFTSIFLVNMVLAIAHARTKRKGRKQLARQNSMTTMSES